MKYTKQIKELYTKVKNKKDFIIEASELFEKSPHTLQNHWFSNFYIVPKPYQARVLELLKETIENQKIQSL